MYQQYVELGFSVIPLQERSKRPNFTKLIEAGWYYQKPDGKKVAVWQPAQSHVAPEETLHRWFSTNHTGIALVAGKVSGRLIYLDFDNAEAYRSWALSHKKTVNSTAVQKTARGYHVFLRLLDEDLSGGDLIYDSKKIGQIKGQGGYVACAPSIHPDGPTYRWLRHPKDGVATVQDLAEVDLARGRVVVASYLNRSHRQGKVVVADKNLYDWTREQLSRLGNWRSDDYDEWVRVGMALSQLGDHGLQLWHQFSARSGKYNPIDLDRKWHSFKPGNGITIASLSYWANEDDPQGRLVQRGQQTCKWRQI